MRICDLNLLLYATNEASAHHGRAREVLDSLMLGNRPVGLPWMVTIGYVRLTTNPRVMVDPLAPADAVAIVRGWLGRSNVVAPEPGGRHLELVAELLAATGTGANLVNDAHLGALAVEHGAELWSFDHDFSRFPGVHWRSAAEDDPD
ncbi:MAG: TA system VapC family ribonuclease toxin [Microthrixaceae bacterium]